MIPDWVLGYVGIPWGEGGRTRASCDCYGLLRLVLAERFGVDIPSYVGEYATPIERDEVVALMKTKLPERWHPVTTGRPGDGVLLRIVGLPWHVGVLVDSAHFVHVSHVADPSCVDRLASPRWSRRVVGLYRHEALT